MPSFQLRLGQREYQLVGFVLAGWDWCFFEGMLYE